jgi:hypothetical protein
MGVRYVEQGLLWCVGKRSKKNVCAEEHFGKAETSSLEEQKAKDFIWNHMREPGKRFYIALSKRENESNLIEEISPYISYKNVSVTKSNECAIMN